VDSLGQESHNFRIPRGEEARQAVHALRGDAYQIYQSVVAWIDLSEDAELHLEVAEGYLSVEWTWLEWRSQTSYEA
jgi:hypothetical protein